MADFDPKNDVPRASPPVLSHLLFVYESILFCNTKPHEYEDVMKAIMIYENASG